ncbi:MAG: hypothetical protein PHI19_07140, partial [Clostridia bacterium]|nr:hypothetical protein [Clostridia bacterium]
GVWATKHGVYGNGNVLSEDTRSIIYELGSRGFATSYSISWATHINKTYKKEVASAAENDYPVTYYSNKDDEGTYQSMLQGIREGDDGVFGVFEYTDHAGHFYGFSIDSPQYVKVYYEAEAKGMLLIDAVEARETYEQEDWLIIITTDHGGYRRNHGGTTTLEKYTFLAINKAL